MTNQKIPFRSLLTAVLCLFVFSSCQKDPVNSYDDSEHSNDPNYISLHTSLQRAKEIKNKYFDRTLTMNLETEGANEIKNFLQLKSDDGTDVMRIVNFNGGGFVILSADRRAVPVIAYSEESYFTIDTIPVAVRDWLYDSQREIESVRANQVNYSSQDRHLPFVKNDRNPGYEPTWIPPDIPPCQDSVFVVGRLLQTDWDQGAGYNNMMPVIACSPPPVSNGQAYVGCTATAMAQIIRYYEYPNTFNYSIMLDNVSDSDTSSIGANAIASLMSAIDSSLTTTYSCAGTESASSLDDIVSSFTTTFGYSTAVYRAAYDHNVVVNELRNSRPVILVGYAEKQVNWPNTYYRNAHAWVAEGYREIYTCPDDAPWPGVMQSYFYMNWGWGGMYNGWYYSSSANPGNGSTDYKYNRKMVVGIQP